MDCSYMNQNCSGSSCSQIIPPVQPRQINQMYAGTNCPSRCPNTSVGGMEQYPIGMGYVPWQQWTQTYPMERGLNRGTIFPDLDLPFVMGRCRS